MIRMSDAFSFDRCSMLWHRIAAVLCIAFSSTVHAVSLEPVVLGLTAPIGLADPADGTGRLFIQQQDGIIRILQGEALIETPLLDLRSKLRPLKQDFEERGLLGFSLHPQFRNNGKLYVSYTGKLRDTAPSNWNYTRYISELTLDVGASSVDLDSERVLLAIDWPSRKHNGGGLAFGPDGYLYVGLGDGGGAHGLGEEVSWSAFDVPEQQLHWDRLAQDVTSLYGSVLRIDVDSGFPRYGIPESNPFVGKPGRDEIYAWGFRNPYRLGVDHQTGSILVTAIAETLWESIYLIDAPGNFGWPIREGTHCINRLQPRNPPKTNDCQRYGDSGYRIKDPIFEYTNMQVMDPKTKYDSQGVGTAVVGGRFYRGSIVSDLKGKLVFADWSSRFDQPSGQLFVATPSTSHGELWKFEQLAVLDSRIVSVEVDASGELYILTNESFGPYGKSGGVYKVKP